MSFITQFGSKQYIVDYGQKFAVDRLNNYKEGDTFSLEVLHTFAGDSAESLNFKVVAHVKGKKIRVVKYRSKSNYHKQYGHRPKLTILEVVSGKSKTETSSSEESESEKQEISNKTKKTNVEKEEATVKSASKKIANDQE